MKFSIIHPTARVTADFTNPWWKAAISAAVTCKDQSQVEYVLVVHASRIKAFWRGFGGLQHAAEGWGRFIVTVNHGRDCLVDQCNAAYLATSGDIIVGNQDDMRYPIDWDADIAEAIPDPSQLICLEAQTDGKRPDLLTIPTIATRPLTEAIGALSPEYDGMYSDNEWSLRARQLGTVIPIAIHFDHLHPAHGLGAMDEVYRQENSETAYKTGLETFARRMALGFPRVEFARPARAMPQSRTIAICCPGESHHCEWTMKFLRAFCALAGGGWIVRFYFGYSTNVYGVRIGLANDVLRESESIGEPEFVLWIDDDNTPSIEAIRALIRTLDHHPEMGAAAGWCWIRTFDENTGLPVFMPSCGNFKPGSMHLLPTTIDELYRDNAAPKAIEWTGFPTLLMRYSAMKVLEARAFRTILTDDTPTGMSGEDTAWCWRARDAAIQMCVVPQAKVEHFKFHPIEPDYRIGPNANADRAKGVESDRERRNGPRLEISEESKTLMESTM